MTPVDDLWAVMKLIDAEMERLREPVPQAPWWKWRDRSWVRGYSDARSISVKKLYKIKHVILDALHPELRGEQDDHLS